MEIGKIKKHLSKDPTLKPLVASIVLEWNDGEAEERDVYFALIRAIMGQQLSVKAASTILGRFLNYFKESYPNPNTILEMPLESMRAVGLSRQKSAYVTNVAQFFKDEKAFDLDWDSMENDEIIKYLTQIKGVGRWTTQMILMFNLNREDVFPEQDHGVVQSIKKLYNLDTEGKALRLEAIEIARHWSPYRSYACRYLWKWRDA